VKFPHIYILVLGIQSFVPTNLDGAQALGNKFSANTYRLIQESNP
jgi:hypothetical protein